MTVAHIKTDYIVSPGEVLSEFLDALGLDRRAFGSSCGLPPQLIDDLLSGEAALDESVAIQFGRILDTDPMMWMNLERNYRVKLALQDGARGTMLALTT